jgi:hypothetical protein
MNFSGPAGGHGAWLEPVMFFLMDFVPLVSTAQVPALGTSRGPMLQRATDVI